MTSYLPRIRRSRLHFSLVRNKMGGPQDTGSSSTSTSSAFSSPSSSFWSSALRRKPLPDPAFRVAATSSDGKGLVRSLGLFQLVLLGIGASIGAGIFVVTGTVAHDAGPGVTVSFILAGAACVLNALCYAELSTRFPPVVGGAYLYTYSAFNELTAFLVFAQLMLDYHIGAASIARSLSSYLVSIVESFPFFKGHIPSWVGGGEEIFGGISINVLAPVLLVVLTLILCRGVGESSALNSFMTMVKVIIVIIVIFAGAFEVDPSNWSPFAPNDVKEIVTGATVVFFAYVGFDAVANSAEESKSPQRDLPIGIIASVVICALLYVGVCLVITGMVSYTVLGGDAPLAEAFTDKGLKFVSILISIGAVAGLTTTLLVGLYVQSRLYLGLGRDGLIPPVYAKVHPILHTPVHSQIWVGAVAGILAGLFNVSQLSHILSVGTLTGYSVVSACVITLRWKDNTHGIPSTRQISHRHEGVISILLVALAGFVAGLCFRYSLSAILFVSSILLGIVATCALYFRHAYADPPGFSCPGIPVLPAVCIFFNIFLFAQLHVEAWWRFVILTGISIFVYAFYGRYNADPSSNLVLYQRAPAEDVY